MAQGGGKKGRAHGAGKLRSQGSHRKHVGKTAKNMRSSQKPNALRDAARGAFTHAVESAMAQRLPSDQRAKMTVVKNSGAVIQNKKKGKRKPLVRGRKRKH